MKLIWALYDWIGAGRVDPKKQSLKFRPVGACHPRWCRNGISPKDRWNRRLYKPILIDAEKAQSGFS